MDRRPRPGLARLLMLTLASIPFLAVAPGCGGPTAGPADAPARSTEESPGGGSTYNKGKPATGAPKAR